MPKETWLTVLFTIGSTEIVAAKKGTDFTVTRQRAMNKVNVLGSDAELNEYGLQSFTADLNVYVFQTQTDYNAIEDALKNKTTLTMSYQAGGRTRSGTVLVSQIADSVKAGEIVTAKIAFVGTDALAVT